MAHRDKIERQTWAEKITGGIGSWKFVNIQTTVLVAYLVINTGLVVYAGLRPFDPFPFVFLNLMLSFQAAYTGPIVLMAQNAQSRRDKKIMMALLHLAERADAREKDMEHIMTSIAADQDATQALIEALPRMIRRIVHEEVSSALTLGKEMVIVDGSESARIDDHRARTSMGTRP